MSDSLQLHGLLYPTRLLHPWTFPSKNTGVGCHFLLQGIFLTQQLNLGLLHYRQMPYCLSHKGSMTYLDSVLKAETSLCWQRSVSSKLAFVSSHVWMWELDHKEDWTLKNWCFQTVMLKTLESPFDFKEIKPVIPKEISPEYSFEVLML